MLSGFKVKSTKMAYMENQVCLFLALSALSNPRPRPQDQDGILIYSRGHTVGTKVMNLLL